MGTLSVAGVALRGACCALPERRVLNQDFFGSFGEKAVTDVAALTGVSQRYWASPAQTAGDLCGAAATRLLARLNWAADSVDALLFVSQTPDQRMPATACLLHGRLGLASHCQAFDVSLGCSGYVYGIWLAAAMLRAGCRRILLLAGDTSSRLLDPEDRATALLFGDAGSASALEADDGVAPMHFVLGSDGSGAAHLAVTGGGFRPGPGGADAREALTMDGGAVFGFTLRAVPTMIQAALAASGRAVHDIDLFLVHQANRFILSHLAKKLRIEPGRMPVNIDRFGNTSSASIPLLLCTDLAGTLLEREADLLLAGFGVGFSWGAGVLPGTRLRCAELVSA